MALQYDPAPPSPIVKHRQAFQAVLAQIPQAVLARRRAREARPEPPPTVFILDWDDTCCPTSTLERMGFMADLDSNIDEFAPDQARLLRVLETRVLTLLKTAVGLGTVLIVTNAGDGWVELSSSRFLPAVRAFLEKNYNRVKVISARARYVDVYREQPLQWKALTFTDELRAINLNRGSLGPGYLHVVVLGDSVGDQYAAHVAANTLSSVGLPIVLKVVKFLERPTIDQLCKELGVLLDHLLDMTAHKGPFDVSMYKEQPKPNVQQRARTRPVSQQGRPANSTAISNSVEAQRAAIAAVSPMAACSAV